MKTFKQVLRALGASAVFMTAAWTTFVQAEGVVDASVGQPPDLRFLHGDAGFAGHETDAALGTLQEDPPEDDQFDFGDAPDPPYPTLLASGGARHMIVPGAPWLGDASDVPDAEPDGQPDSNALGDDNDSIYPPANDDEDGVSIPVPLIVGAGSAITVTVGAAGWLDAWVDWNGDGSWQEPAERIFGGTVTAGPLVINVTPPGPFTGQTFARFRIYSGQTALLPTGDAPDGEVEDHELWIESEAPPPASDWKWRQPPDLTPDGFDVECMKNRPILLADDFLCTTNTAITNIVVWGSWLYDELPFEPDNPNGNPSNVFFTLSFHTDIPAGVAADWSMPGEHLWSETFGPGTFEAHVEAANIEEGWYDPATTNYVFPADTICWRYTFPVDLTRAFVQTGTVENPIVYWLNVQADPLQDEPVARFGWKTTPPEHQWNDDACWAPGVDPYNGFWWDMHYPPGHPLHDPEVPHSFDLAFALYGGPVPEADEWDFGDAPDPTYPTLLINNGARHRVDPTGPWLGDALDFPDPDLDGQPDPNALGDDADGNDDENGVIIPQLIMGQAAQIQVIVSDGSAGSIINPGGVVDAWIDWNGDGVWQHPAEQIFSGFLPVGTHNIAVVPPTGSTNGWTFARFRISRQGGLAPTGSADDGEVEDHQVFIDHADWGDAPDPPYPTLAANNGAWHVINPGILLGVHIDAEADGQPVAGAVGDDNNPAAGPDDEDGIQMVSGVYPGMKASVRVTVVGDGYLSAWLDLNGVNGWDDFGEQVMTDVWLNTGVHDLTFDVPAWAVPGNSYMRWRYSSQSGLGVRGGAADGEVEDHEMLIRNVEDAEFDFGDAPPTYPTLLADDGARHVVVAGDPNILGALIDAELDGQPTDAADGDDLNNLADEDGVRFPTNSLGQAVLVQGSNMAIRVVTPGSPWLSAWIDFDGDGSWAGAGEQVAAAQPLFPGTNLLMVTAPANTFLGKTYARFRTSSMSVSLPFTGAVADGEIEDYMLYISQPVPAGGTAIAITNLVFNAGSGAALQWLCDSALLTLPQFCTNLVESATNPAAWVNLGGLSANRYVLDAAATNAPVRFYRVLAPFVYP